jgi:hypothetical protein
MVQRLLAVRMKHQTLICKDVEEVRRKLESRKDGHPIIENYVRVRHAARHLKTDVTPHAPET